MFLKYAAFALAALISVAGVGASVLTPVGEHAPTDKWRPIPGAPSNCTERIARDPASAVATLRWRPCSSGRAGCETLITDWSPVRDKAFMLAGREPVRLVNGTPFLSYVRLTVPQERDRGAYDAAYLVTQELRGHTAFALKLARFGVRSCTANTFVGETGIAIQLDPISETPPHSGLIAIAPWSNLTELEPHPYARGVLQLSPSGGGGVRSFGSDALYMSTWDPETLIIYRPSKRGVVFPQRANARLSAIEPLEVGDTALALEVDGNGPTRIISVTRDGVVQPLITPSTPGQIPTAVAVDRSQHNTLVWVESRADSADHTTQLWTSPFSLTESGIIPRLLKSDAYSRPSLPRLVVNAGMSLNVTGRTTAELTRLMDGKTWRVEAEPGEVIVDVAWVDEQDVYVVTGIDHGKDGDTVTSAGMLRLRRDQLGLKGGI